MVIILYFLKILLLMRNLKLRLIVIKGFLGGRPQEFGYPNVVIVLDIDGKILYLEKNTNGLELNILLLKMV